MQFKSSLRFHKAMESLIWTLSNSPFLSSQVHNMDYIESLRSCFRVEKNIKQMRENTFPTPIKALLIRPTCPTCRGVTYRCGTRKGLPMLPLQDLSSRATPWIPFQTHPWRGQETRMGPERVASKQQGYSWMATSGHLPHLVTGLQVGGGGIERQKWKQSA